MSVIQKLDFSYYVECFLFFQLLATAGGLLSAGMAALGRHRADNTYAKVAKFSHSQHRPAAINRLLAAGFSFPA